MTTKTILDERLIKSAICELTKVERTNQGLEVCLPQIYHTGNNVAVVVHPERDGFYVHDNGYAAMLLSNSGVKINSRMANSFLPLVESYGCIFQDMRVSRFCEKLEQLGVVLTLVGCASRLIADHALKVEKRPVFDFKSSLLGKVVAAVGTSRIRTNEDVTGHLGSHYRVSTVVLDRREAKPIAFVEPITDRDAVSRRFKEFYDIKMNPSYAEIERVAVYDDSSPISSGDALLIQEVGNLVRFADAPVRFSAWGTVQ